LLIGPAPASRATTSASSSGLSWRPAGDATDGFLKHMVQRSVDLFAAVIVDAGVVRESQHLNERLAEGSQRVGQEVERASHGEALADRELGGS
jgi:hypothetical protein